MHITLSKTADQAAAARAAAYPPVGDQLDALFKMVSAMADAGLPLPAETRAWIAAIRAVKDANPKPAGGAA